MAYRVGSTCPDHESETMTSDLSIKKRQDRQIKTNWKEPYQLRKEKKKKQPPRFQKRMAGPAEAVHKHGGKRSLEKERVLMWPSSHEEWQKGVTLN